MTEARGRTDRQQEERAVRRRRDDGTIDGTLSLKLAVPPEIRQKLTEEGREWRWANDTGNRIYQLTKLDDWDPVEGVPKQTVVIDKKNGTTCKAILLSKPTAYMEADRAKLDARRRETEEAMVEGGVPSAGGAPAHPSNTYVPRDSAGRSLNKIVGDPGNQLI